MYDAIIISDLHLGSTVCQDKQILKFLHLIQENELPTLRLILNGDVFNSWDFRRLCKQQWKILSTLRKLSKNVQIIWINGNHDGPAEIVSHLLGIEVAEEFIFESGKKKILALHGHRFDNFIAKHPILTFVADRIYTWLQRVHIYWARSAKRCSKTFLRCSEKIELEAKAYAHKKKCHIVCCGHTHLELEHPGEIGYFNSGCWTELPCSYLTIFDGEVKLRHFES
jgi:UDP-2,3-diacylglucosamine pyrophosphatase LpxH